MGKPRLSIRVSSLPILRPPWLTISEYAREYHVHRKTICKWLADGLLISWRVGRTTRIQNAPPVSASQH